MDIRQMAEVCALLTGAALLGGIQGLEREWLQKPAGLRTHMLVALGAAVFVLAPREAGVPMPTSARRAGRGCRRRLHRRRHDPEGHGDTGNRGPHDGGQSLAGRGRGPRRERRPRVECRL
jgi:hypothetical protein